MPKEEISEDKIQMALVHWLRDHLPENVTWCAICNERDSTAARGNKFKKMGIRSGWSDLQFFKKCDGYTAIYFLELKRTKYQNHKKKGMSDNQIDFMDSWEGWPHVHRDTACGFPAAKKILCSWFCIKDTTNSVAPDS